MKARTRHATPHRPRFVFGLVAVIALLISACTPATPAALPTATATVEVAQPEPEATATTEPTAAPAATSTPEPTPTPEPTLPMTPPSVTVTDQSLTEDRVTIAEVVSNGPGWLVIHAQADGGPGPVIGYSPVADGVNANVTVTLDRSAATSTLYAMLHTDAGDVGTYEFPGADGPVVVGEQVVTPSFTVSIAAAQPSPSPDPEPEMEDDVEIEMEDFEFRPESLTIPVGTTVKWSNRDDVGHTTTSDTGLWDSGILARGEDFFFTFTEPGTYPYYCIPHGGPGGVGMAGTIIVTE